MQVIYKYPHPNLRIRAKDVPTEELNSDATNWLIGALIDTMEANDGAGLAATQIGYNKRVAVIRDIEAVDPESVHMVLINPRFGPLPPLELVFGVEGGLSL